MQANPGKLVRQIVEALKEPPSEFVLSRLAEDYVAACTEASQRLDQCLILLSRQDEFAAWNIASTPPDLLELLEILAFPQSIAWKQLCKDRALPIAPFFDDHAVEQVGALYAKGINETHPLYNEFRKASRLRDDAAALRALISINRLNPGDAQAAAERTRLELKYKNQLLTDLDRQFAANDRTAIVSTLQKIEDARWSEPVDSPLIERAQITRESVQRDQAQVEARALLRQIEEFKAVAISEPAEPLFGEVETLTSSFDLPWSAGEQDNLRQIKTWLTQERSSRLLRQKLEQTSASLEALLARLESRPVSRLGGAAALANEKAALERAWREVEAVGQPIPEILTQRVGRLLSALRAEIARRQRLRYIASGVVATAALVAVIIGAWLLNDHRTVNGFSSRLAEIRAKGTTTEAASLLALIDKDHPKRAKNPALAGEMSLTRQWQIDQAELFTHYAEREEQVKAALQPITVTSTPEELAAAALAVTTFDHYHTSLAKDYQDENAASHIRVQTEWEEIQHRWAAHQNGAFREKLTALETSLQTAFAATTVDEISAGIQREQPRLDSVELIAGTLSRRNALAREDAARVSALSARVKGWRAEQEKWQAGERALHQSAQLADHRKALETLQAGTNKADPFALNARLVLAAWDTFDSASLLRENLLPGDPQGWAFQKNSPPKDLDPRSFAAFPPETVIFEGIDQSLPDPEIVVTEIEEFKTGGSVRRKVFTKGKPLYQQSYDRGAEKKAYSWKLILYTPQGTREDIKDSTYQDKRLVEGTGVISHSPAKEQEFFNRFLGKKQVDGGSGRLKNSPLLILDELNKRTDLHPLFRAYVQQELIKVIEMRPYHWGAHYNLALTDFIKNHKAVFATPLEAREWLFDTSNVARKAELAAYNQLAIPSSIWPTAQVQQLLIKAAMEGAFVYAGQVDMTQRPRVIEGLSPASKIWTVTRDGQLWQGSPTATGDLQPLAPVFVFRAAGGNEAELLTSIRSSHPDYTPVASTLPLLFRP